MPDLARDEAMRRANLARSMGWNVHFKFYCDHCGERCTLQEANILYEYGECFICGLKTKLDMVGFLLVKGVF